MVAGQKLLKMLKELKDNIKKVPDENRIFIKTLEYSKLLTGKCSNSEIVMIMSCYKRYKNQKEI